MIKNQFNIFMEKGGEHIKVFSAFCSIPSHGFNYVLPSQRKFYQLWRFRFTDQRFFFIQCRKLCHFISGQRKIKQIKILFDMLRPGASRNDSNAFLRQKTKQYLCWSFTVFFSACKNCWLLKHFIAAALTSRGSKVHTKEPRTPTRNGGTTPNGRQTENCRD